MGLTTNGELTNGKVTIIFTKHQASEFSFGYCNKNEPKSNFRFDSQNEPITELGFHDRLRVDNGKMVLLYTDHQLTEPVIR